MNKNSPNKLKKTIISIMVFLLITTALFVLSSCRSISGESSAVAADSISNESIAETTTDTGVNTTDQSATSEIDTTTRTETTVSVTGTTNQENKQIIEVTAKTGGYSPRKIDAKAGVPATLIMTSDGAYGCERSFNIFDPNSKKVLQSEILPENGKTEFDLGTQARGVVLLGVCSMGMYYFQITFN